MEIDIHKQFFDIKPINTIFKGICSLCSSITLYVLYGKGIPLALCVDLISLLQQTMSNVFPTLTDVLSTPSETQLSHDTSFATNASFIEKKIAAAVDALHKHKSRKFVTILCWFISNSLTVTGFIFSRFWSLLQESLAHLICQFGLEIRFNGTVQNTR